MSKFEPLYEGDIVYRTKDGEEIDALMIGEDSGYFISYGHVDPESFIEMISSILEDMGETPEDFDLQLDEIDIEWTWAERLTPESVDEWIIGWNDVRESTPNSFPLTVLNLW